MSASGGPAADNELRAKLTEAATDALLAKYGGSHDDARRFNAETLANVVVRALVPLVVTFGDARYREGRNDAGEDAMRILEKHVVRLARGEG